MAALASIATLVGAGAGLFAQARQAQAQAAMQRAQAEQQREAERARQEQLAAQQQAEARARADDDRLFRARLAAGRASLLNPDASFTGFVRAGQAFGTALRSLLD